MSGTRRRPADRRARLDVPGRAGGARSSPRHVPREPRGRPALSAELGLGRGRRRPVGLGRAVRRRREGRGVTSPAWARAPRRRPGLRWSPTDHALTIYLRAAVDMPERRPARCCPGPLGGADAVARRVHAGPGRAARAGVPPRRPERRRQPRDGDRGDGSTCATRRTGRSPRPLVRAIRPCRARRRGAVAAADRRRRHDRALRSPRSTTLVRRVAVVRRRREVLRRRRASVKVDKRARGRERVDAGLARARAVRLSRPDGDAWPRPTSTTRRRCRRGRRRRRRGSPP